MKEGVGEISLKSAECNPAVGEERQDLEGRGGRRREEKDEKTGCRRTILI